MGHLTEYMKWWHNLKDPQSQVPVVFFFNGEILSNFDLEKYDFHLYKGFSMEKMAQIHQISEKISFQIAIFLW
jgi:hypothetical protein